MSVFFQSVLKHLDVVAAYYRTGLESALVGTVGVYPVAHGHAIARIVHELVYGCYELLERCLVGSHSGRPHYPVGLGVCLAVVQRESVLVLLLQVVGYLLLHDLVGEDVQAQELVPN